MPALILFLILATTVFAQDPVRIAYECSPEDIDAFGLSCSSEEPCQVFLELTSADSLGGRVLVTGNLHTRDRTLFSVLLSSEDGGVTWTEPQARIRSAALEQIEFADLQTGWVSGESIDPLARDPFFLITNDGGKSWRQKPVFDDAKFGTIIQFHFDSKDHGQLVIDASQGKTTRQELYETMTGGESWEAKQTSNSPIRLSGVRPASRANWRVRATDGAYQLERSGDGTWQMVAKFTIHIADCR